MLYHCCYLAGISLKTQELFLVVFVCRYLDLFTTYYSLYNSCMKILYIALTALTIYIMRYQAPIKSTYDPNQDTFYHLKYAVAPCLVLAFITNLVQGFDLVELLWDFSIYLEALAIVPQLIVLQVSQRKLTAYKVY
jgi:ER lumen protein retaining receptor